MPFKMHKNIFSEKNNLKIFDCLPYLKHSAVGNVSGNVSGTVSGDPGVASSIPARSNTFMEIDHEIISTAILLPSAESFKTGCCRLQGKDWLATYPSLPRKSVVR